MPSDSDEPALTTPERATTLPPADSGRKRVAKASIFLMAGILLSRLLGLVRNSIIAHKFGQGFDTDVYNAAFIVPDLLFFLLAGGVFSGAFTPVFTRYLALGKEKDAWRIFSVVASTMTLVIGFFIILGEIFLPFLVEKCNPGYTPDKIIATVALTRILLPAQICFFLGGLMMATLTARNLNAGQAFGPAIYNLGIIFGALFLTNRYGIAGLCWGAAGGAVIGNLLLQWVLVRRSGGYFLPGAMRKYWHHEGVKSVWKLMLPVILGLALPQVSTIIGRVFASKIGEGAQSALMNANVLFQIPLGVFAQAISIASLPVMAAHAARGEMVEMRKSVVYSLRSILFLTLPSSMIMIVLALPIVQFLLQSGKFTQENSEMTAIVLCPFAAGIFAWSAHSILSRAFYALEETKVPVIVGTIVTFIFIPLNWVSLSITGTENRALATAGLALTTTIAALLHMSGLVILLRKRLKGLDGTLLLPALLKMVLASASAAGVCFLLRQIMALLLRHFALAPRASAGITLLVCLTLSGLAYVGFSLLLEVEEVSIVERLARKLVRR
ncbi:MAG: murein biosynthesis integral membrane protein MurJ [Chthonomonadaceae bacterium]|nr:murein biosynthesis integral membrane protein MurJ [Chthonomonadaceae bacterium]